MVKWATEALDEERRRAWNIARGAVDRRRAGRARGIAKKLKHARYALWKNPEDLTDNQRDKLEWIEKTDPRLYRAYLLKEGLRYVFEVKGEAGKEAVDRWISWARRCRIPAFVHLQRRIVKHRVAIDAALEHGLSRPDRVDQHQDPAADAAGVRVPCTEALIALVMLALGGHRPALPGRA